MLDNQLPYYYHLLYLHSMPDNQLQRFQHPFVILQCTRTNCSQLKQLL